MRTVVLIVGPPGAGKTTIAKSLEADGIRRLEYEMFDSDAIFRDAATEAASAPDAKVSVVRCCLTLDEQAEWERMLQPTEVRIVDTPRDEAIRRCKTRGRPAWRSEVAAVRRWWEARHPGTGWAPTRPDRSTTSSTPASTSASHACAADPDTHGARAQASEPGTQHVEPVDAQRISARGTR